jgi:hypothetical protein
MDRFTIKGGRAFCNRTQISTLRYKLEIPGNHFARPFGGPGQHSEKSVGIKGPQMETRADLFLAACSLACCARH